jgi:phosphatidate cytidylyltransferase
VVRVGSAVILLIILYVTLWVLPRGAMMVVGMLVAAIAARELAGLARTAGLPANAPYLSFAAALVAVAFAWDAQHGSTQSTLIVLLAFIIATGALAVAHGRPSPAALSAIAVSCLVPIYIGLPIGAIVAIHSWFGAKTTTWLLLTIATSDSAQYYTGRAFSPAKTVEGAVGGVLVATAVGAWIGAWALPGTSIATLALVSLGLAGAGILGDLFESLLKRCVGAKDSSALIPGHGGVLDRIDSYLFAAPLLYIVAFKVFP